MDVNISLFAIKTGGSVFMGKYTDLRSLEAILEYLDADSKVHGITVHGNIAHKEYSGECSIADMRHEIEVCFMMKKRSEMLGLSEDHV